MLACRIHDVPKQRGWEDGEQKPQRGQEVRALRQRGRQFPCMVPSAGQGHTFYDLTALRRDKAAPRPQRISGSAPAVLFGMTQEGPNMEAGWRPKHGTQPAKHLWSSSRVGATRRPIHPAPTAPTSTPAKATRRDRPPMAPPANAAARLQQQMKTQTLECWQALAPRRCTGYRRGVPSSD